MEEALTDDQSHYEISLTAGQAFVAFVLLLLSLAASFAFGLLIGRGQADERLVMRKDASTISEGVPARAPAPAPKAAAKIAQVANDDFKPRISEGGAAGFSPPVPAKAGTYTEAAAYAQLLSTSDQRTAEGLAAKLIEGGFTAAYVERTTSEKGTVFRVRIKFPNEADARAAGEKLKQFSKEVWITK